MTVIATYPTLVVAVLLGTGLLIGLLAGLLGVGGGVIAVPVLLEIFVLLGMPEDRSLALAVGTAQASIVVASLTAVLAHARAGTIDRGLVRAWLPAMLAGSVVGLAVAAYAPTRLLTALFAAVAIVLAVQMVAGDRLTLPLRHGLAGQIPPALVGALAAAVGVGGGTLSTPALSLFAVPIKRAIGAGALFNLAIALPAAGFFLAHDVGRPGRPADALGDVSLLCLAALSLPALLVAPPAARWSKRVPADYLRRLFAACLAVIALRLLMR